jgi:hypothetical protein
LCAGVPLGEVVDISVLDANFFDDLSSPSITATGEYRLCTSLPKNIACSSGTPVGELEIHLFELSQMPQGAASGL